MGEIKASVWGAILALLGTALFVRADETAALESGGSSSARTNEILVLRDPLPDPFERFNRAMWTVNEGLMKAVIQPTAKGYRMVVRPPVRQGLRNFSRNLTYPARVLNHLFQARWPGARDESYRFLCNTVLGVGGFFDVASKLHIPKSDADFGQTLGKWGWHPDFYLMLPILGPSNDRDLVGAVVDSAANPFTYISPYPLKTSQPLSYAGPYTYYSVISSYNQLSDDVDNYVRLSEASRDAYEDLQFLWGYARLVRPPDFSVHGPQDATSLETLQAAFIGPRDPDFLRRRETEEALIYTTGYRLPFSFWLQKEPAPLVFIVPGLGSHRLTGINLALAEFLYRRGYSVVTVSNPFNYEFAERASRAAVPGYSPVDVEDLHVALTAVDKRLAEIRPGLVTARALVGYSMGAFESLILAGAELERVAPVLKFDRIVAIDTPVRLLHGVEMLDDFYRAPLEWPSAERQARIENALLKVAALTQGAKLPEGPPPFSTVEAQFLIGMNFRLILRDIIFSSQWRQNLGVLEHRVRTDQRQALYREILRYSYTDYFEKFVVPYYGNGRLGSDAVDVLSSAGDLKTYTAALRDQANVRVLVNRNDFLLEPADLGWLQATFGADRLKVFERGGHLGNLGEPEVEESILKALQDLPGAVPRARLP